MAARSKPSSRRSTLRGRRDLDHVVPVIDKPQQNSHVPSLRSKRPRMASIADQEQVTKRIKLENVLNRPQLRIPLRSRPVQGQSPPVVSPRSHVTDPVLNTRNLPTLKPKIIDPPAQVEIHSDPDVKRPPLHLQTTDREPAPAKQHERFKNDKRTLRSHDGGSRSKSELAQYFQNYEQMISLDPAEPELLTPKTNIVFIDDEQDSTNPTNTKALSAKRHPTRNGILNRTTRGFPSFTSIPLHNAERLDLSMLAQPPRRSTKDSIPSEPLIKAHRRPERQEKQLRNIEKERAQHEKVQLDRLLEELKGPDWLKVMGISGVTETEKKLYEPKRIHFVKEVNALIDKFKQWKEEEKRRKTERDQAMLEQLDEEVDEEQSDDGVGEEEEEDGLEENAEAEDSTEEQDTTENAAEEEGEEEDSIPGGPHASPTNSSDVDAQASRQLLYEASKATSRPSSLPRQRQKPLPKSQPSHKRSITTRSKPNSPPPPPSTSLDHQPPITSFFSKSHVRAATIAGYRRGRAHLAFGQPVPELPEQEFGLPGEILTEKNKRESGRRGRRLRRGTVGSTDG